MVSEERRGGKSNPKLETENLKLELELQLELEPARELEHKHKLEELFYGV